MGCLKVFPKRMRRRWTPPPSPRRTAAPDSPSSSRPRARSRATRSSTQEWRTACRTRLTCWIRPPSLFP